MDAFLTHLDEELINGRPGRHYGTHSLLERRRYTPRELAFWINFYALFYDTLYMPPNFLTDNRLTLKVLEQLSADDRNSLIRSSASPVRIYWEDRWPSTFEALVQEDWKSNESVTAQMSKHLALEIAKCCEDIFSDRIDNGSIDTRVDRMHSLKQMKKYVFSERNAADLLTPRDALSECVAKIEERPMGKGYGRNLLYAMFGYFRRDEPPVQLDLRDQFADIVRPYQEKFAYFTHEFLMGLDYVSHELKSKRASEILGSDLKLLMPADYYDGFRRTRYDGLPTKLDVQAKDCVFVDVDAIIALSPKQLEKIRCLPERADFMAAFAQLEQLKDTEALKKSEGALGKYLRGIGCDLHPTAARVHKSALVLRPGCRLIGPSIAFAFVLCGATPTETRGAGATGVAIGLALEKGLDEVAERTKPSSPIPVSQIALTEEVRLNLEK